MSAKPYRKGAKAYRGLGLGQAIPVTYGGEIGPDGQPEGPRPARKGLIGHGAQATGDLPRAKEKAWRERYGELNLGLHLEEGVISADVDDAAPLRAWLALQGWELPPTPFSTARGADSVRRQLVYRLPDGIDWSSNGLLPAGGEIIDAGHRYVRAWPSIHKSGARYEWYFPTGDAFSEGRVLESPPSRDELAELPAPLALALMAQEGRKDRARGTVEKDVDGWLAEQDHGTPTEHLKKLARAVPEEGADNNALMDLFGPLVRAAWGAPGGATAVLRGVERYSGGYGADARAEAMQAVGRAIGDYRAELDKRAFAVTFPIRQLRTTEAAAAAESSSDRPRAGKAKKGKRKARGGKAAKPAAPAPATVDRSRPYVSAMVEIATDDALRAEYAARDLAGRVVFAAGKMPYVWDGVRWVEAGEPHARELVREWHVELGQLMVRERPKEVAKVLTAGSIDATLRLLHGLLARDAADFDAHPDLLNTPSGVVDLRTKEVRPHDPALLMTHVTGAAYVPGTTHKDWKRALEAMPEEARAWFRAKMGQAITGYMADDDVMPIAEGGGENAKSTIFAGIMGAVGDYATLVPDSLLQGERQAIPVDKMTLRGVRIAIAEEASEDRHLNSKQIKDVLGTPRITARAMYSPYVTFPTTHTLFLTTNHRLSVTETDWGTWRRLALLRFPYRYVVENRDPEVGPVRIADPLKNERVGDRRMRPAFEFGKGKRWEAILVWLVDAAAEWYAAGRVTPPVPQTMSDDTAAWRSEQDAIMRFIDDRLVFGAEHFTTSNDLYQAFVTWLQLNGRPKWGIELFTSRFSSHDRVKAHNVAKARRKMGDRQYTGWDLVGLRPMTADLGNPLKG